MTDILRNPPIMACIKMSIDATPLPFPIWYLIVNFKQNSPLRGSFFEVLEIFLVAIEIPRYHLAKTLDPLILLCNSTGIVGYTRANEHKFGRNYLNLIYIPSFGSAKNILRIIQFFPVELSLSFGSRYIFTTGGKIKTIINNLKYIHFIRHL